LTAILRVIDLVNKWIKTILGVLLAVMSITIMAQVFSRFVLGSSITWSEELARLLMAYIIFIAAAVALRYQKLIAVEIVPDRLRGRSKTILTIFIQLIGIIFFFILLVQGVEMVQKVHLQQSAALRLPMSVFYACVPIGAFLLIMNSIAVMIETFTKKEGENK
jgi:TRAP-type transport system small permease protein